MPGFLLRVKRLLIINSNFSFDRFFFLNTFEPIKLNMIFNCFKIQSGWFNQSST